MCPDSSMIRDKRVPLAITALFFEENLRLYKHLSSFKRSFIARPRVDNGVIRARARYWGTKPRSKVPLWKIWRRCLANPIKRKIGKWLAKGYTKVKGSIWRYGTFRSNRQYRGTAGRLCQAFPTVSPRMMVLWLCHGVSAAGAASNFTPIAVDVMILDANRIEPLNSILSSLPYAPLRMGYG